MKPIEIVVIALSVLFVLGVAVGSVIHKKKKKRKGVARCCSDCSNCAYHCNSIKEKEDIR